MGLEDFWLKVFALSRSQDSFLRFLSRGVGIRGSGLRHCGLEGELFEKTSPT